MSFPVQNIRDAAKERNMNLAQIEKALSIGNGVIAKWEKNKGTPPYDRIVAIAELLEVPVSRLTGEKGQKEKPSAENDTELDETTKELINLAHSLNDDDRALLLEMARSIRKRREDHK